MLQEKKTGSHSINTIESSSFFDEETGKKTTINETWSATETQYEKEEQKKSFSEYWGIGRYFIVICLIIFFISPVYTELNQNWKWQVEEEKVNNGAVTHYYYTNNKTTNDYIELGNDMLSGFVSTMENIGSVSNISSNITERFGWVADIYNNTIGKLWHGILEFIGNIFG